LPPSSAEGAADAGFYLARQMGAFERRSLEVTFADAASAAAMRERR